MVCRLTTYRHRFARAAPAPRAKRNKDSKNRGRASPVKYMVRIGLYSDQSPSRAPRAATRGACSHARGAACVRTWLPDVAAAAAPRASRAGLPLCGSGPDNVWQRTWLGESVYQEKSVSFEPPAMLQCVA